MHAAVVFVDRGGGFDTPRPRGGLTLCPMDMGGGGLTRSREDHAGSGTMVACFVRDAPKQLLIVSVCGSNAKDCSSGAGHI